MKTKNINYLKSKSKYISSLFLVLFYFSITDSVFGQTTYISGATGNGDFESGTTGWTLASDATNIWWCGTTSFCAGSNGAYIGTAVGNNTYTKNVVQVSHIYRSVAFTAGETQISLSLTYKGNGESTYDGLKVYMTASAPSAGTEVSSLDQLGTTWYNLVGTTCSNIVNLTVPGTYAGTTKYLVFSWINDNSSGADNAITIDDIILTSASCTSGLPYTESFESITTNNTLPSCMASTNLTTKTFTYTSSQTYNRAARTGTDYAYFKYSCDDWIYTQALSLTGGVAHNFSFWYVTDGNSGWTTLDAFFGNAQNSGAMTTAITGATVSGPTNQTYVQMVGTFTPSSSGIYYCGIHCLSNSYPWYLSIDDINVSALVPMAYSSSTTTQTNTSITLPGATNQEIIGVQIVTTGSISPIDVTSFTFNTTGSTAASDITNAKLWTTGTSSTFATATQLGATTVSPSGSFTITGGTNMPYTLASGTNYFWLTYDISSSAVVTDVVDAQCTEVIVAASPYGPTQTDPPGSRTITARLSGTVNVGSSETYLSLTCAGGLFEAINTFGLSGNLIAQITSDITECGTFACNQWTESGAGNYTVTIRPTGAARVLSADIADHIIDLDGADRVTFDGRVDGVGTSKQLTISNINVGGTAIRFINDATNNTFKYCILQGINNTTTSGVVVLSTTTGSTGNDNITIDNCDITSPASPNEPKNAIFSQGTVTKENSTITITNNNIYNFELYGINVNSTGNGDNWNVSGNSFYNTYGLAAAIDAIKMIYFAAGASSNSNTINGNYLGGTLSSCGGSQWNRNINSWLDVYGIYYSGGTSATSTISNNTIKNYAVTGLPSFTTLTCINISSGNVNLSSNTIGDPTGLANSIYSNASSMGLFETVIGIKNISTGTVNISNNSIAYLDNPSKGGGIQMIGISTTKSATITGNTISNITTQSANTGTLESASIIGILVDNTASELACEVSNNTISGLNNQNSEATAYAVNVIGILYNTGTFATSSHIIKKNRIHTLSLNPNKTTASITGIQIAASNINVLNNMVDVGNGITNSIIVQGVNIDASSGDGVYLYHNSVYIGGAGVSDVATPAKSYAFKNDNTASSSTMSVCKDNIFMNARATTAPNTNGAKHYAYFLNNATNTSDYNVFYTSGLGGTLFTIDNGTTDYLTLQAYRFNFNQDMHSIVADPIFINPTATPPNLHINTGIATPVEATGILISDILDDYDGDTRASLTPTDIGADAGNFMPSDIFPPVISYTQLGNGSNGCGTNTRILSNVTITDQGTGVPLSGGNMPRIWFKKNAGTWFSSAGTLSSGDGNDGIWSFTIDYVTLGGVVNGDIIYYYVVAQDQATSPNVWFNNFDATTPVHPSVTVQTTPPSTPNSYTIVDGFSGTYTVGATGTYPDLTSATGFFQAINNGTVIGNIIVNIVSDITEDGTNPLNQWAEDCGSNWTMTIQSSDIVLRTISGTLTTNSMIRFNGADRVTITGGAGKYLTFRNTTTPTPSSTRPPIEFNNGSINCTLTNCTIESNSTNTSYPNILIGTTGTNNITISNNDIRDATGGTVGDQAYSIYSNNATNTVSISNNNIFNWTSAGIYLNNIANGCIITGNSFYNTSTPSTTQIGIYIGGGSDHSIIGNYFGGQSASCGGSAWASSTTGTFEAIEVSASSSNNLDISSNTIENITLSGANVYCYPIRIINIGNTIASSISNNTIQNITISAALPNSARFYGIWIASGTGLVTVASNLIGHTSVANSISTSGSGECYGIYSFTENASSSFSNNIIANITLTHVSTTGIYLYGMSIEAGNIKKNKIYKLSGCPNSWSYIYGIKIAATSVATTSECSNNMISLDGVSAQDHEIRGIDCADGNHTISYYYNSSFVYGSTTGGSSKNTYSFFRNNSAAASTNLCRNNIFINSRTKSGGTGYHYAASSLLAQFTSDYNFFAADDASNMFQYGAGSSSVTWSEWKGYNGDASSWYVTTTSGISSNNQINPTELFNAPTFGDLTIKSGYSTVDWFVSGKGIAGASSGSLNAEYGADTRGTTLGYSTDIGADEFGTSYNFGTLASGNQVTPHTITLSGWANSTPQTFSIAGRDIATLEFKTGTPPTSVDVKYYSGDNPEDDGANSLSGKKYSNVWWSITPTGGSGYTYDLTLNYDVAMLGSIVTEATMLVAKWLSPYASNSWVSRSSTVINTTAKTAKITGESGFSEFILLDGTTPLPIQLLNFSVICNKNKSTISWATAAETNNDYFSIEKSVDGKEFSKLAIIKGSGTSNIIQNYNYMDEYATSEIIYYRLSQTDFDGSTILLGTASTECEGDIVANIELYPNPSKGYVYLNLINIDCNIKYFIISSTGQVVMQKSINAFAGKNADLIDISEFSEGLYRVNLLSDDGRINNSLPLIITHK